MESIQQRDVRYNGVHCQLAIEWLAIRVVRLRISGTDVGEFGAAPMLELGRHLDAATPIQLFIDARQVRGASIDVSGEWARWLGSQKLALQEVHMLTGSRFIQITADFVRRFAELQGVMKVYTDADAFEGTLAEALVHLD
jgi:hypothetical protein